MRRRPAKVLAPLLLGVFLSGPGPILGVEPVLDAACVECHDQNDPKGLDLRADKTDGFSLGYENLRPHVKTAEVRIVPLTTKIVVWRMTFAK